MKQIFRWLRRVTGISTPFGGLSWSPSREKRRDVPIFNGTILLTSEGNDEFISFLEQNARQIVFLEATIDACVATKEQIEFSETENIDFDSITSGAISGQSFLLQNGLGRIAYVAFHLTGSHIPNVSFGGTGTIMLPLNGFFEVTPTLHGGPSTVFHLKEIDAPLDARLDQLNSAHTKT